MHLSEGYDVEVWMPVPSLPGVQASSWGRLLLPAREYRMPHGGVVKTRPSPRLGSVARSSKNARHVYRGIYNRILGNIKVHRAVCEAFHGPPPFPRAVVIHLDEDGLNNRPENLKWGTQKENLNMPGFVDYCRSRTGDNSPVVKSRKNRKRGDTQHGKV